MSSQSFEVYLKQKQFLFSCKNNLTNLTCQNICNRNNNKVIRELWHFIYWEKVWKEENNLLPTREAIYMLLNSIQTVNGRMGSSSQDIASR